MSPIEHEPPPSATDGLVRVVFQIEDQSLGDTETLWAEPVEPDVVRVDSIPLLVFGVSMGDLVRVAGEGDPLTFAGVAEHGGHSTYRVMLGDPEDAQAQERLRSVIVLGCGHEQLTPRFMALDVPPHVDVYKVYELLERGLQEGVWTFEEGHCGHPLDEA